jgi:hypothetical protein
MPIQNTTMRLDIIIHFLYTYLHLTADDRNCLNRLEVTDAGKIESP